MFTLSKKCDVCHYWHFLDYSFKFEPNVCNRSHNLSMMSINLRFFAILNIKCSDYCFIISLISQKKQNIIKQKIIITYKNGWKISIFKDVEIEKNKLYGNKTALSLRDI